MKVYILHKSWYDDEEINRYNYVVNRNASENAGLGSENANSREIQNFIKERINKYNHK